MTGAYTRRGVVVLVVLAVGLSVAAPALGAATVSQDDGSTTTFGDGLDDSTSDSDGGTTTSDSTTDGSTEDDDSGGLLDDSDDSSGDSTDTSDDSDSSGDSTDDTDDSDGLSFDDGSDGEDTNDSESSDSTFGSEDDTNDSESGDSTFDDGEDSNDSDGTESGGSTDDGEQYDWSIPNVTSTTQVVGTETTMVLSPDEIEEGSLAPTDLVDVDRTVSASTSETDSETVPTTTAYELAVADLSTSDPGPLLLIETSGDTVASTSTAAGSLGTSIDRIGDSLATDISTAPTSDGRSSTTAASLDAARVSDGADRTTGATGGANDASGSADVDDTGGSAGDGPAAVDARQPGRQALDLRVPTDDLPVPSDPAGVGMALGATALAAAGIRQSSALSGMAGGFATSVGTAASTMPGSSAVSRLVRMLAPFRYSRYDDSDPLEHEARDAMFEVVESSPGTYLSEIADRADIPLSTARHHIRVLEREDLVSGAKVRGKRRFYPAYTEGVELAAAMNDESTAAVIDALARLGAASVSDLADELGRDPSTVSHHVQRLEEDDVVVRERDGRAVMNKLSAAARTALDPEEGPSDSPTAGEAMASD
jgi:DNA-binding MarR family transcriptional regulator